jgi:uncharacterized protein YegP (UPF0339 family)
MFVKLKVVIAKAVSVILVVFLCLAISPITALATTGCSIQKVYTDKARYNPGNTVTITVAIQNSTSQAIGATLNLNITHLGTTTYTNTQSVTVPANSTLNKTITWTAPSTDYTGYLVAADLNDSVYVDSAVDVSSTATRFPRYGYTSDFSSGETQAQSQSLMNTLSQDYHIDMVQYYDWMYRHELDFPDSSSTSWNDLFGNTISQSTIQQRINAGHNNNQVAMAYQMANMALEGYSSNGVSPQWGIYSSPTNHNISYDPSTPSTINSIMQLIFPLEGNPGPIMFDMFPGNVNWQNYIIGQYKSAINRLGFDGIQMDQMGNFWGNSLKYNYSGSVIDLADSFSSIVNNAKTQLTTNNSAKNIVTMNIVNGATPSTDTFSSHDIINNANTDFDFSEIWENSPTYNSLKQFVEYQKATNNKALEIAAYMNYYDNAGTAYDAASATRSGLTSTSNNGTNYVTGFTTGSYVSFSVTAPEAGDYTLIFNYTNGNSVRATKNVYIDGSQLMVANFDPTRPGMIPTSASWTDWSTSSASTNPKMIYLTAGTHTIKIQQDSANSGDIDLNNLTLGTFNDASVRLTDDVLAACGANHIEMGTGLGEANSSSSYSDAVMLGSPYYPAADKVMRNNLRTAMKNEYNFTTAYENLLYDTDINAADGGTQNISITGQSVSGSGEAGKIFFIPKQKGNTYGILNLVNLTAETDTTWRNVTTTPTTLTNLAVKYYIPYNKTVSSINVATPDNGNCASASLSFTTGTDSTGTYVSFTVPSLAYWDMIYLKWTSSTEPTLYEAESSIKSGVTTSTSHAGYTGTGFVDGFGAVNSSVTFNIDVPTTGYYMFNFKYANDTGATCYRDLILDNSDAGAATFYNQSSWDTWANSEVGMNLKAGRHTLVMLTTSTYGGYINLDNVSVHPAYEAETATLTNTTADTSHTGYTGTGFVDGFAEVGDKVTFAVNVATAGTYSLNFRYANDDGVTATKHIYVDGTSIGVLSLPTLTSWDAWSTASMSATLSAGAHTICISYDSSDDHAINLDNLTLS